MERIEALLARQRRVAVGVAAVMLVAGAVLYPELPARMAIHWSGTGGADGTAAKPVALLAMPAIVLATSALFAALNVDRADRIVGSLAFLLLLAVQSMVLLINLGVAVPIVPVTLALCLALVAVAVELERRGSSSSPDDGTF